MNSQNVAVIGGGLAGLSCAYSLMKLGINTTLYEKNKVLGGVIQTNKIKGYLIENGPSSFLLKDKRIIKLFDELNLNPIIANNSSQKRYILKKGKLVQLPISILDAITTPIISCKAKFNLMKEPFITSNLSDESVTSFFSRRLGSEVSNYLIDPFVSGTFAGNPDNLSIKHAFPILKNNEIKYGSLLKGLWESRNEKNLNQCKRQIISFKNGLQELPLAIEKKIGNNIYINSFVKSIKQINSMFELTFQINSKTQKKLYNSIVIATETNSIPKLVDSILDITFKNAIKSVFYPPVAIINFGIKSEQIKKIISGFGILIPKKEKKYILGILFNSMMFSNRSPVNHELISVFMGGSRHPDIIEKKRELKNIAWKDLQSILGVNGEPQFYSQKIWNKAIPQYSLEYEKIIETINNAEKNNPGLFFTGNYLSGISMSDTILNGTKCASMVSNYMKSKNYN